MCRLRFLNRHTFIGVGGVFQALLSVVSLVFNNGCAVRYLAEVKSDGIGACTVGYDVIAAANEVVESATEVDSPVVVHAELPFILSVIEGYLACPGLVVSARSEVAL